MQINFYVKINSFIDLQQYPEEKLEGRQRRPIQDRPLRLQQGSVGFFRRHTNDRIQIPLRQRDGIGWGYDLGFRFGRFQEHMRLRRVSLTENHQQGTQEL